MSILERLKRLAEANLLAWKDRAENAEESLTAHIGELEKNVEAACSALAEYAAVFKRTEQEQKALAPRPAECLALAERALRAGDESKARRALEEKLKVEQRLQRLEAEVRGERKAFEELQTQVRAVREQLEKARRHLAELQARGRAAAAQRAMGRHVESARREGTGGEDFRRMETDVFKAESALDIKRDLRGEALSDDALERMQREESLDAEMDALRRKVAGGEG